MLNFRYIVLNSKFSLYLSLSSLIVLFLYSAYSSISRRKLELDYIFKSLIPKIPYKGLKELFYFYFFFRGIQSSVFSALFSVSNFFLLLLLILVLDPTLAEIKASSLSLLTDGTYTEFVLINFLESTL